MAFNIQNIASVFNPKKIKKKGKNNLAELTAYQWKKKKFCFSIVNNYLPTAKLAGDFFFWNDSSDLLVP